MIIFVIFEKAFILLVSVSCIQSQQCNSRSLARATGLLVRSGISGCLEVHSRRLCRNARLLWLLLRRPAFGDEDEEDDEDESDLSGDNEDEEGDSKYSFKWTKLNNS